MNKFHKPFAWGALCLAGCAFLGSHSIAVFIAMLFLASLVNLAFQRPSTRLQLTLSVPEISYLVIEAFKTETPELFEPGGFALDVSSDTARLGDTVTSHITSVPATANYDPTPGVGFMSGVQDATSLLTDVPVTLNYFAHIPIRIKWLSQLSSKLNLSVALMHQGYALRKKLIDTCLATIPVSFSYQKASDPANFSLDTLEQIRGKLNTQKAAGTGRFGIINSALAQTLQSDQRVGSSLFYGQLNGDRAYHRWKNIAGFGQLLEYPDFPNQNSLAGYFGDPRGIIVALRPIDFTQATPESLGIPRIMSFTRITDPVTKAPFVGVGWQDPGTGDLYTSIGLLWGVTAGTNGGGMNSLTDRAGVRLVTQGSDI